MKEQIDLEKKEKEKESFKKKLEVYEDERGRHVELFRLGKAGQVNYSESKPGTIRGNHYHTRKRELFCVIEGEAKIKLRNRKTGERKELIISGRKPELVEILPYWVHSIENIGDKEMKLIYWVSEEFNPDDSDTYYEKP